MNFYLGCFDIYADKGELDFDLYDDSLNLTQLSIVNPSMVTMHMYSHANLQEFINEVPQTWNAAKCANQSYKLSKKRKLVNKSPAHDSILILVHWLNHGIRKLTPFHGECFHGMTFRNIKDVDYFRPGKLFRFQNVFLADIKRPQNLDNF